MSTAESAGSALPEGVAAGVSAKPRSTGSVLAVLFRPSGHVDHRLARRHVVNEVKRGRLDRSDVCDAHPDLLRAAKHLGQVSDVVCPICEDATVRYVTYAFGPRLPAHGKLVENDKELARLDRGTTELQGYTVEACPACGWHHLQHSFAIGRKIQSSAR